MLFEGGDGGADVIGLVRRDVESNSGRKVRAYFVKLGVDTIDDFDGVDAGLAADVE